MGRKSDVFEEGTLITNLPSSSAERAQDSSWLDHLSKAAINITIAIMLSRTALSSVCGAAIRFPEASLTQPVGRWPSSPPATQPTSLVQICRAAEVLPIDRDAQGDRSSSRVRTSGTVHEGDTRDAAVRVLESKHSDSGSARSRSAEVHGIQRTGGRGAQAGYADLRTTGVRARSLADSHKASRSTRTGPRSRNCTSEKSSLVAQIS